MRSLAAVYDWLGGGQAGRTAGPETGTTRLPSAGTAREDIHLYVKTIDNTNVVRVVDKKDWTANIWAAGSALLGSLIVSALVGPSCYGLLASRARGISARRAWAAADAGARTEGPGIAPAESQECRGMGRKEVRPATAEQVIYPPPPKETVARLGGAAKEAR